MSRVSSTSASEARGHRYAPAFFLAGFLVLQGLNWLFMAAHEHWRRESVSNEWSRKIVLYENRMQAGPIPDVFIGDSTVMVGIQPEQVVPGSFNLGVGGLDPSELTLHEQFLRQHGPLPKAVFLSISPNYLSTNEWKNPSGVPWGTAAWDAGRRFYADQNGYKPVMLWGARPLQRIIEMGFDRFLPGPAEFQLGEIEPDGGMHRYGFITHTPALDTGYGTYRARTADFALVDRFATSLRQSGVRVIWIQMPYRSNFERILARPGAGLAFAQARDGFLARTFGRDLLDFRGTMPDSAFRDDVHLTPEGSFAFSRLLAQRVADQP